MSFEQSRILETCQDLWQVVLGLSLEGQQDRASDEAEPSLSSYVNISGNWQGAVVVECPESITRHAAAMLFSVDTEAISRQELQDALNELTRMVGKNIQKLLPQPGKVSAPRAIAEELPPALATMQGLNELLLSCEGRPVRIKLLQPVTAESAATG